MSVMERPNATRHLDALELQLELQRYWTSETGRRYARSFWASVDATASSKMNDEWIATMQSDTMKIAETFWVSGEMTEFAEHQAASPHLHPLFKETLPAMSGFILLDKSVVYPDSYRNPVSFRAFSWTRIRVAHVPNKDLHFEGEGETRDGIHLAFYSDIEDEEALAVDIGLQQLRAEARRDNIRIGTRLILMHHNPWVFGVPYVETSDADVHGSVIDGVQHIHSTEVLVRKFLTALWAIMATPITMENKGKYFPRSTGKRAAAQFGYIPDIRVITLRRVHHNEKGGNISDEERQALSIEWSHRWIVTGHWRNQWIPSLSEHRPTWIGPYIKGPENKPLVFKDKIYRVSR